MSESAEVSDRFVMLINAEEQYSIWPQGLEVPNGWRVVGAPGTKSECSEQIDRLWTDMRPLSLRRKMEGELQ